MKNKVIVSVQALSHEPLYDERCMVAMMKSVVKGGAAGLRVAGPVLTRWKHGRRGRGLRVRQEG